MFKFLSLNFLQKLLSKGFRKKRSPKWNEESFIEYLTKNFPAKKDNLLGIGDDCAVIPFEQQSSYLITTDALVEGIHFLKDQIPPHELGYKTIAVNVSDIAAMGGTPQYAFLSIAIPKNTDSNWLQSIIQGMKDACAKWNILLLGGDTVGSKRDLFLNLTLVGTAATPHIKYRNTAKPKDIICVNGYLGDSAAGLKILQSNLQHTQNDNPLIKAHFHPEPSPKEGAWFAKHGDVHALIDISDGLDSDLKKILKASSCGAVIETTSLPLSNAFISICQKESWDPTQLALSGGEDYCLLLTIAETAFPDIQHSYLKTFGKPLSPIGFVTEGMHLNYQTNGKPIDIAIEAFHHF